MDYQQKALSYRNRADECRAMASDFRDEGRKRVLESLADDYEMMATQIEQFPVSGQRRNAPYHAAPA